jgi:hypothetical protein
MQVWRSTPTISFGTIRVKYRESIGKIQRLKVVNETISIATMYSDVIPRQAGAAERPFTQLYCGKLLILLAVLRCMVFERSAPP